MVRRIASRRRVGGFFSCGIGSPSAAAGPTDRIAAGGLGGDPGVAARLISTQHSSACPDVILAFNVGLFLVAMAVLGVEAALYSILTYLTAARTLDFVIHGIEEYTAMTIVSNRSSEIREAITGILGRGVTVYRGRGGLTNVEQDILYCVVTRLEIGKIKTIARNIDDSAFIVSHALSDVEGGVVKKTALHIGEKGRG